jgi:arylsulfatase A-like enzyme
MKRRSFLNVLLKSSVIFSSGRFLQQRKRTRKRPNILWLMTDEQRLDSLSYYGTSWAHTPHLDRLAREGVFFMNAYTPSPVCMPARVAMLTGKYCSQTGVWRNLGSHNLEFNHLTSIFCDAGYRSATFGKQNYGGPSKAFQKESSLVSGHYVDPYGYNKRYDESKYDVVKYPGRWVLGGRFPESAEKSPEAEWVDAAIQWLKDGPEDQPFLLRLSFSAPHTPVVPPPPFDTLIDEKDIKLPGEADPLPPNCPIWTKITNKISGSWALNKEQKSKMRRYYYGYVAFADDQFGRLLRWMKENGYLEHTIIAFVSDHGTHLCDHGFVQKGTFYDESAKVPYFFWYPKKIARGVKIQTPVETRSLLPTLLGLAGLMIPEYCRDINLADCIIRGQEPPDKPVFSEISFRFDARHPDDRSVMVRNGGWKLSYCVDAPEEKGELINLAKDPYEQNNLYEDPVCRAVRNELIGLIQTHLKGTGKPYSNVKIMDALLTDEDGNVICPICRRNVLTRVDNRHIVPDWADSLGPAYQCNNCGMRFGLKKVN